MRAFAHASLLAVSLCALDASAGATTKGLFPPQSPTGPGGEDTIETSEGTRCRQSINNNGAYADAGVVTNRSRRANASTSLSLIDDGDYAMGYVRVTIPLGAKPKRIDCTQLYDLEISRLRREIELLKLNAE